MNREYKFNNSLNIENVKIKYDEKFDSFLNKLSQDPNIHTCIKNKHKFTINKKSLNTLISSWGQSNNIKTHNMFYFYPNLDKYHNTNLNYPLSTEFNDILDNSFNIRLDHRIGNMVVISSYNMLVIDFDVKDFYAENFTQEEKKETYNIIKNTLKRICDIGKDYSYTFVWHLSESDKGFHAFLINQYVNINEFKWLYFMLSLCGDIQYVAFTYFHGWCVRLSKKSGRMNDYVAKQSTDLNTIILPNSSNQNISLIYNNIEDLKSIKVDLLKLIKYKYNLIKYFNFFTDLHAEYILYYEYGYKMTNIIRTHLKQIWESIIDIKEYSELIIFNYLSDFTVLDSNISNFYEEIEKQLNSDGRNYDRKKLIDEMNKKYLKYKSKYLKLKKILSQ